MICKYSKVLAIEAYHIAKGTKQISLGSMVEIGCQWIDKNQSFLKLNFKARCIHFWSKQKKQDFIDW